jgi:hypothetical protein
MSGDGESFDGVPPESDKDLVLGVRTEFDALVCCVAAASSMLSSIMTASSSSGDLNCKGGPISMAL